MTDLIEKEVLDKRVESRDAQAKQTMRDKISFTKTLKDIDAAEIVLFDMIKEPETTSAQVGVINALLNSKWKKISKLLPDLRHSEISGSVKHDHTHKHEGLQDANSRVP